MFKSLQKKFLSNIAHSDSIIVNNFILKLFGLFKVPFLFLSGASIQYIDQKKLIVSIPLTKLTKNHLKKRTMYFAVLTAGADCAAGFAAMRYILQSGQSIELVFEDLHAQFIKKAQSKVYFECNQIDAILELVEQAKHSFERVKLPIEVIAYQPQHTNDIIARFQLTISLKQKVTA
jgi:hypothetical protein